MNPLPAGPIVFLHLQKTGGSSIHHLLKTHLPAERLVEKDRKGAVIVNDPAQMKGRVISGHVNARFLKKFKGRAQVVTVLREPTERLLSHYYFLKSYTLKNIATYDSELLLRIKRQNFAEFLRDPEIISWLGDYYVKQLDPEYDPKGTPPSLERAMSFLHKCAVVGTLPHLNAFVRKAFPYFGLSPDLEVPIINRLTDVSSLSGFEIVPREPITPADAECIKELTRNDYILYQYAETVAPRNPSPNVLFRGLRWLREMAGRRSPS